jgi:sugar transferase (PEP-CTERM/EpsH1 system associated)
MEDLLFLVHRIPYPPNKGDKIRSFEILRFLSKRYRVHLATFVDDPNDWKYRETVEAYCASSFFAELGSGIDRIGSFRGLLAGRALTLPYYYNRAVERWVEETTKRQSIDRILVFSSAMAQYVMKEGFANATKVMDFVDKDSDKWRQYALRKAIPARWIYQREFRRLEHFEKEIARCFHACLFVSRSEAELFQAALDDDGILVDFVPNGVDTDYFRPDPGRESPFRGSKMPLVFTGVMDYWANVEGVAWFAEKVLPAVRGRYPDAEFYIVGMRPSERVRRLGRLNGVVVTGAVADVRPYLQYAQAVVVPLRIARGIQNKVLEAMAMSRPVVATPQAMEGIDAQERDGVIAAREADEFADRVMDVIERSRSHNWSRGRDFVSRHFNWDKSLPKVVQFLESA